jgi:hypothetical protein
MAGRVYFGVSMSLDGPSDLDQRAPAADEQG